MKIQSKRLYDRGFSHVEIMLVILIVAVVVFAGAMVYSKNNTTHAGGYQTLGQYTFSSPPLPSYLKQAVSVRACVAKTNGTNWVVHSIWSFSHAYNTKDGVWWAFLNNYTTSQDTVQREGPSTGISSGGANAVANVEMGVSSTVNNYLQFTATFKGYSSYMSTSHTLATNIRPSNLPSC